MPKYDVSQTREVTVRANDPAQAVHIANELFKEGVSEEAGAISPNEIRVTDISARETI
jgi:capsular polysaccharide biosynthesis protein